jgi:inositol hexakisphosphate/diphosphoinositol-pentakisphosphate kinase
VPDVYDMTRYDLLHNPHLCSALLTGMYELHSLAKAFENCVVPQEYGTDEAEKRHLGSKMCGVLLEKINYDLNFALNRSVDEDPAMLYRLDESHAGDLRINSLGRSVRTRLYFTSESHMHTLLNVLRYSGEGKPLVCEEGLAVMDSISEIGYLSQIVIRLFEDKLNPENVHCELNFSPGAINDPTSEECSEVAPYVLLDKGIPCDTLIEHLGGAIKLST